MNRCETIVENWLTLLKSFSAKLTDNADWEFLGRFREDLRTVLSGAARDDDGVLTDLLGLKAKLAGLGYGVVDVPVELGGRGASPVLQAAMQFVAGYHDLDLRDAAHAGHGRLILHGAEHPTARHWARRLAAGELVGIAVTEENGGTNVGSIATSGRRCADGSWSITGRKIYVSRIAEAVAFVVFFRSAVDHGLAAAIVPTDAAGLHRIRLNQEGLRGWSWGRLIFDDVRVAAADLLTVGSAAGRDLFTAHFDYYRPMVSMTALGAAAWMFDSTVAILRERLRSQRIDRPLDSTLERLGAGHARLHSALLASLAAVQAVHEGDAHSSVFSRTAKAHGVGTAYECVDELQRLLGADTFRRGTSLNKVLHDLRGYLYADGVHDALLQSAGSRILRMT